MARAFSRFDPRQASGRLLVSLAVGLVAFGALGHWGWAIRVVGAWDALAITLLGMALLIIGRADATETRRRASAEDPGRTAVWVIVLLTSTFSVFAGSF